MPNYRIVVEVDPSRAKRGSKEVEGSLDKVERRARSTGEALTRAFAVLGIAGGIAGTIGLLKDFEQEMSTVKGITGATQSEFKSLRDEASRLGTTTRFSATQAAEGMTFLARAGFDTNEVLGATEGTLRLAQAGALDLGRAADIASNILTGFRLEVAETGRVVDVLAAAANTANTDVGQLGEAMKFVAPVASGMGVQLETATAAINALSDAGLQGSLAGTGLRRILSELESPATKTRKIFTALGLSADQVKVSQVGLIEALTQLRDAGVDTGLALEIFGDRGGPAFEVLSTALPKVQAAEAALRDADGTAQRLADTMDDNLNGSLLATKSAAEGLILAFGENGATGGLRSFFDILTGVLRSGAENIDVLIDATTGLVLIFTGRLVAAMGTASAAAISNAIANAKAAASAQALTIAQGRMAGAFGPPTAAMVAQTGAAGRLAAAQAGLAAAGRGVVGLFGGPLGLALTAAGGALFYLYTETSTASRTLEGLQDSGKVAVNELFDLEVRAREAGINVNTLGTAASDSNPLIRAIAGSYGVAANEAKRLAVNAREAAIAVAQGKIAELRAKRESLGYDTFNTQQSMAIDGEQRTYLSPGASLLAGTLGRVGIGPSLKDRFKGIREINNEIEVYARQIELLKDLPDQSFAPPEPPATPEIPDAPSLSDMEGGPGGSSRERSIRAASDVMGEFNKRLQDDIELAGLSGAAHQERSAILDLENQLGRKLNDTERENVSAKLQLLAAAQDLATLTEYSDSMRKEVELLQLNTREREIAQQVMRIEDQLRRKLTDGEKELVEQRARELQQAREAENLNTFAENLEAENAALRDVLPGNAAREAIMRKELELGRQLDPVERQRIANLVEENIALREQRSVYESLNQRRNEAISQLRTIAELRASGQISDLDARAARSGIGLVEDLNQQGTELGGGFDLESRREQLQNWTDEQNRIVADGLAARLLTEDEAAARSVAIEEERQRRLMEIQTSVRSAALQNAQAVAEGLTDIAKNVAGEQSAVYKAMFVASKAFAIADSIIKIQQGVANALSLPFPANIAAVAAVVAQASSIISNIQAVRLNLADGGLVRGVGGPRADMVPANLSAGEFVMNSAATAANYGLLDYLNRGGKFDKKDRPAMQSGGSGMKVVVNNFASGVDITTEQVGPDEVRVIAKRAAEEAMSEGFGDRFQSEMAQPNSKVRKAVFDNTDARPRR